MSMHKKPLTPLEEAGLRAHGLDIGKPSQLSDVFRQGVAYALAAQPEAPTGAAGWQMVPKDATNAMLEPFVGKTYMGHGQAWVAWVDALAAAPQPPAQPEGQALTPAPSAEPDLFKCDIQPRPLNYPLSAYHRAGIDGPLAAQWADKPHRLLYDLIAAVRYYAAPTVAAPAEGCSTCGKGKHEEAVCVCSNPFHLSAAPAEGEPTTCKWCCGTGQFSDHACRFCAGAGKGSVLATPTQEAGQVSDSDLQDIVFARGGWNRDEDWYCRKDCCDGTVHIDDLYAFMRAAIALDRKARASQPAEAGEMEALPWEFRFWNRKTAAWTDWMPCTDAYRLHIIRGDDSDFRFRARATRGADKGEGSRDAITDSDWREDGC